jgi:PEP-CTERM motif
MGLAPRPPSASRAGPLLALACCRRWLKLTFNIGATGGVSTSGSFRPDGLQVGLGIADIGYALLVGGTHAQGTMSVSSGSPINQQGQWGTVTGSVEITPTSGVDDDHVFAAFNLSLSGHANARAIHNADPTMPILFAKTDAEFGSTLIWEGIIDAQAFDRFGAEIPLPDGFEIGLIGSQTGMNYWHAAPRETADVPAPGSFALLLLGLGLLGARWPRRR